MYGNVPIMFDCLADVVVHLIALKSSTPSQYVTKQA